MVVGYDGREGSRLAASWAARELSPEGRLVLVHSDRPLHAPPSPLVTAAERSQVGEALFDELMLEAPPELLDLELATEVSDRDPVSALLHAAERHGASAIVVGCEQHSRLHNALGVVTTELLQRSTVPVIAVPATVEITRADAGDHPPRGQSPRSRSGSRAAPAPPDTRQG